MRPVNRRMKMSDALSIADPYRVRSGDTLGAIAQRCGHTVAELQRFNKIANPNRLEVGQTLYLSKETAFGVSVQFLDALRHPIENLAYRLQIDGKTIQGITDQTGAVLDKISESAHSKVEVWTKNADNQWQQLTSTVSGYGHKLITLVSGFVVVKGQTEKLPDGVSPTPDEPQRPHTKPPQPPKPTGAPTKNNPNVKTRKKKGPKGESIITIGVEIPQDLLDYFAHYTGEEITEDDWALTARKLECEVEVLKAIAKVESGGRSAFWRLNKGDGQPIPALRYERHYFSRLTKHQYDKTHTDISWPAGSIEGSRHLGEANKRMLDGKVEAYDLYPNYSGAYLRLINAYKLDDAAALESCSWGKFQIMGENYKYCGAKSIREFITDMCSSEAAQIGLLAGLIQNKPAVPIKKHGKIIGQKKSLWQAVKDKDWVMIAYNYNGSGYRTYKYDDQIESAYNAYKKKSHV